MPWCLSYVVLTLIGLFLSIFSFMPLSSHQRQYFEGKENMYSLFVTLSRAMGRYTIVHKENSYKELYLPSLGIRMFQMFSLP